MHLAVVGFFPEFCLVEFHSWKYNKKTGAGGWGLGAGGWGLGAGGWGLGAGKVDSYQFFVSSNMTLAWA